MTEKKWRATVCELFHSKCVIFYFTGDFVCCKISGLVSKERKVVML